MLVSMLAKVQVAPGTPISFTAAEADMLRTLLYIGKQDYGRGSGGSVFETGVRTGQQRTVEINGSILAKLKTNLFRSSMYLNSPTQEQYPNPQSNQ